MVSFVKVYLTDSLIQFINDCKLQISMNVIMVLVIVVITVSIQLVHSIVIVSQDLD